MMIIRRASHDDIASMLAVKNQLKIPFALPGGEAARGGFLLGSSPAQYAFYIERANVFALEDAETKQLEGFAITLPDDLLRGTDVWARRRLIEWGGAGAWETIEKERVGYFEQLAVLPPKRIYAAPLALAALKALLDAGHEHVFATVVRKPFHNTASLRMLESVGAQRVGQIDEDYEEVGQILSDVYYLHRANRTLQAALSCSALGKKVISSSNRLSSAAIPNG